MRPLPVFSPLNASTVLMFVVSKRRLFVFSVTSFFVMFSRGSGWIYFFLNVPRLLP